MDDNIVQTELEVTLKLVIRHPENALDQNSVKGLIAGGMNAIASDIENLYTIGDEPATSINVSLVKLKEDGKVQNIVQYGTMTVGEARGWAKA